MGLIIYSTNNVTIMFIYVYEFIRIHMLKEFPNYKKKY